MGTHLKVPSDELIPKQTSKQTGKFNCLILMIFVVVSVFQQAAGDSSAGESVCDEGVYICNKRS